MMTPKTPMKQFCCLVELGLKAFIVGLENRLNSQETE